MKEMAIHFKQQLSTFREYNVVGKHEIGNEDWIQCEAPKEVTLQIRLCDTVNE